MSEEEKKEADKRERRFDPELLEKGLRCDLDQYEILKRCSGKKDMTEWNEWQKENPKEEIWLQGAKLRNAHLEGVHLSGAHLERSDLLNAHLEEAQLSCVNLKEAQLGRVHMEKTNLFFAHLEEAKLLNAHLEEAKLYCAHLERADLFCAHLENTELLEADLQGAKFTKAYLQGADFSRTVIDGETLIWDCKINKKTKFEGIGLGGIRIYSAEKQLLEYNIRRMNWEDWYKEHWLLRWPVQMFWAMSDYGMSTLRVMGVFFLLALLFAAVYMSWAYWSPPGIVSNLVVQPEVGESTLNYFGRMLIRPIYFSIVTMTTLGIGDMYANKGSIAGHVLLILQVILGYVLLGALITRFAVLFTAGGPAGKFVKDK
jgi:uncharacterized protein YjbI with pentapeptide repeats